MKEYTGLFIIVGGFFVFLFYLRFRPPFSSFYSFFSFVFLFFVYELCLKQAIILV